MEDIELIKQELEYVKKQNIFYMNLNKSLKQRLKNLGLEFSSKIFDKQNSATEKIQNDGSFYTDNATKAFKKYKYAENITLEKSSDELREHIADSNIINTPNKKNEEKTISICSTILTNIKTDRHINYNSIKNFTILKSKRMSTSEYYNYVEYKNIVKTHYELTKSIVEEKKRIMTDSQIKDIKETFSEFDLFIIEEKSHLVTADDKEIEISMKLMENSIIHDSEYKIFSVLSFFDKIKEFLKLPLELDIILEKNLINLYDFNNICFLESCNINKDARGSYTSPYNFYIIKNIISGIRFWDIDWRLENLLESLAKLLIDFYIIHFRNIYNQTYGHNLWKKELLTMNSSSYLNIILKNICYIQSKSFSEYILNIVERKMKIKPTEKDRFNLFSDNMTTNKNTENNLLDIFGLLFDDITEEHINNTIAHVNAYLV
jgi:hypothetical protein